MAKLDNGSRPAFPPDGRIQLGSEYDGLTKREWFAGQALVGIIAHHGAAAFQSGGAASVADRAYAYADAMVALEFTDAPLEDDPDALTVAYMAGEAKGSERLAEAEADARRAKSREREARRLISETHKRAVTHENCQRAHCPICDGGLFVCADCGAAEIETEQRICTAAEADAERMAEALRRLSSRRKSIEADVLSAHSNRGNGPSEWMREEDRDFRSDLRSAFEAADAALAVHEARKGERHE